MKIKRSLTVAVTLAGSSLVGFVPTDVQAQDISEEVPKAFTAMGASKGEEAQGILAKVMVKYKGRGKTLYGGKFGALYYNKGFCELKIAGKLKAAGGPENIAKANGYYDMAVESFKECYKIPSDEKSDNLYHIRCLLYMGQAQQSSKDYSTAIESYKKFLAEREEGRDKYDPGTYSINMAICHFRLGEPDFKKGIQYFETSLNNKDKWKTPDEAIVSCFQALTEAVIKTKKEQALIDFLNQNRAAITLRPYQMVRFAPFFQKLAAQSMEANMMYAAFNLFALIPGSDSAVDDLQVIQKSLALYPNEGIKDGVNLIAKARLAKDLKKLQGEIKSGDPQEVYGLTVLAYTHEKAGNVRGAFAAYKQLELYFNKSSKREDNLYNLVRTSAKMNQIDLVQEHGQVFLDDYPESKHVPVVRSFMLTNLFASGQYKTCLKVASGMIDKLKKGTDQHDLCLHVLSASKFYLGDFVGAHPQLLEHVATYPKSDYKIAAEFFIELEFKGSSVEELAYNLKGNIFQGDSDLESAKKYYLKALEVAESRGNDVVAGEALNYLVSLLGSEKSGDEPNTNLKEAISYYDKFWKNYQSSPFKAQVAVAGIPALSSVKRSDEALANLQAVISEKAALPNSAGLEEAIGSYTKYWLQNKVNNKVSEADAADQLKDHYYAFPDINVKNVRARAMLRIAIIGVYEESLVKAEKESDNKSLGLNQARINQLFKELKNDFPVKDLSNFVLIRIGDYLRKRSKTPRQALPYYEERLARKAVRGQINAQFGIADIFGLSSNSAEQEKAIVTLENIIRKNSDNKKQCDEALYRIVEIYGKREDWSNVVAKANEYNKSYKKSKSRVTFLLAQAYENQNKVEDAIKSYTAVYISNTSNWSISIPALDRASQLMWKKGDQQKAYEFSARYIKSSQKAYDANKVEMDVDVRKAWESVRDRVKSWEQGGKIETLQQIRARKNGK